MPTSLAEICKERGLEYALVRKHAQRGKLKTVTEGGRLMVDEADFEVYLATEKLGAISAAAQGKPLPEVAREYSRGIADLPPRIRDAILLGLPCKERPGGSSEPFRAAVAALPARKAEPVVEVDPNDPHCGFPVGHQHRSVPRWKRIAENVWELNGGTFSWTGLWWEGGGAREGKILDPDLSPASPHPDLRPLAPPSSAATDKKS